MSSSSILPPNRVHEIALFFVVATLSFFVSLSGIVFKTTYGATDQWISQVENQITVRIIDSKEDQAVNLITDVRGVISAKQIERDELVTLLEPSFQSSEIISELPLPTVISVLFDTSVAGVDEAIKNVLKNRGYEASVVSHAARSENVRWGLDVIQMTSLVVIGLLTVSTILIIAITTHSTVATQGHIVRVLYLAGARDGYITGAFIARFWFTIFLSSLFGAILALGTAFLLILAIGNESRTVSWLQAIQLGSDDFLIPIVVPIVASLIALATTRSTIIGTLKKQI